MSTIRHRHTRCIPCTADEQPSYPDDLDRPHSGPPPYQVPWEQRLILVLGREEGLKALAEIRAAEQRRQELFELQMLTAISWDEASALYGRIGLAPEPVADRVYPMCLVEIGGAP